jgi:hypothetical protein
LYEKSHNERDAGLLTLPRNEGIDKQTNRQQSRSFCLGKYAERLSGEEDYQSFS